MSGDGQQQPYEVDSNGRSISADGTRYWDGNAWQKRGKPDAKAAVDAYRAAKEARRAGGDKSHAKEAYKEAFKSAMAPEATGAGGKLVFAFEGINGQLEVFANKVTIKRKGLLSKVTEGFNAGEKDLYFNQIGSLKVKLGGGFTNGFIQFAPTGGMEYRRGIMQQTKDENTIMFKKSANDEIGHIRGYLESRIHPDTDATPVATTTIVTTPVSVADELQKLADLKTSGLLSEEEFQAQKSKLLG